MRDEHAAVCLLVWFVWLVPAGHAWPASLINLGQRMLWEHATAAAAAAAAPDVAMLPLLPCMQAMLDRIALKAATPALDVAAPAAPAGHVVADN